MPIVIQFIRQTPTEFGANTADLIKDRSLPY